MQEEGDKDTPRVSLPEEEGVKLSAELAASAISTKDCCSQRWACGSLPKQAPDWNWQWAV